MTDRLRPTRFNVISQPAGRASRRANPIALNDRDRHQRDRREQRKHDEAKRDQRGTEKSTGELENG